MYCENRPHGARVQAKNMLCVPTGASATHKGRMNVKSMLRLKDFNMSSIFSSLTGSINNLGS